MDEITVDTFTGETAPAPEALSPEQKTFLTEHAADLADDVATKYGVTKPAPAKIVPEVRGGEPATKPAGEGDEIDPEDEAKIAKIVTKLVSPYQQQSMDNQNSIEVDSFIRDNQEKFPFANKYRQTMLEYMKHPAYSRVPAKNVFNIVAGEELIKWGAQKERDAAAKAKGTRVNSSSGRPAGGGTKDYSTMSKADFEAERAKILGRPN